jgi:hypothetical protein
MKDQSATRLWQIGAALAVLLAIPNLFSGHELRSYDAPVHMFFADHYMKGWFELWDERWYGGFSVASYPPLAHQLLALLSFVLPRALAYSVLTAIFMIVIPLTAGLFARIFVDDRSAAMAVILCALWPVPQRVAYDYGQLPTIVAAPIVLFAMTQLHGFLRDGSKLSLARYALLMGAMAGAHHQSMLFGAFCSVAVGTSHLVFGPEPQKNLVPRLAIAAALAAVMVVAVGWPVILYGAMGPQKEMHHFSRDPLWQRVFTLDLVQQVGSAVAVLAATIVLASKRAWKAAYFGVAAFFFFLLSFGDTTPIPGLLFGAMARYFVYDRFTYWGVLFGASVLGAAALALGLATKRWLTAIVFVMLPMTLFTVSYRESAKQPPLIEDLSPLLAVLNAPGAESYRHLTLGFGDQLCLLDMQSRSPNADGDYHAARSLQMLKDSGMAAVDTAKFFASGKETLRKFLALADELSLRWVFVYDEWYHPFLFEAGFELAEVWPSGVVMFERASVPPITTVDRPTDLRTKLAGYGWGLLPIACVFFTLVIGVFRRFLSSSKVQRAKNHTPGHTA